MPIAGILLIVGFVIIVVLAVIADKTTNKKFAEKFAREHQAKETYGDFMITTNGELIYILPSGTLQGYKMWKLNEIGDIAFADIKVMVRQFSVQDKSGKTMKGEYLTPSKKPLKEYSFKSFTVRNGNDTEKIIELIRRNAEGITFTINGKPV